MSERELLNGIVNCLDLLRETLFECEKGIEQVRSENRQLLNDIQRLSGRLGEQRYTRSFSVSEDSKLDFWRQRFDGEVSALKGLIEELDQPPLCN